MLTTVWSELQKRHGKVISALLATFMVFYLVSHTLGGERGLYVLFKEQRKLELLRKEIDAISGRRKALEHRTDLLRSGSLDPDLLDEQARRTLGNAGKDELMILMPAKGGAQDK